MIHDRLVKEKIQNARIQAYEQALTDSRVVLSQPERTRLFRHLLEDILTEIINENRSKNG